jgi:hypothetical protein
MADLRNPFPTIALLFLGLCIVTQASPAAPSIRGEAHVLEPRGPDPNAGCPFPGNSDLYGFGIRIGIYLQLLSTLLANSTLSDQLRDDAHNTNAIIMIALFAGMVNATVKNQLNAVEIFVMCFLLMAFLWSDFTPRHISSYVLVRGEQRRRLKMKERVSWTIPPEFLNYHQEEADEIAKTKNSYFAAIARSTFGTAIAVYNLWYWLYARHPLLKHGISDEKCKPVVFLQARVELGGNQVMLYVIFAVANALFEVVFMAWWLFVLTPGTLRLFYELVTITSVALCTWNLSKLRRIKKKAAIWYLGFARLNATNLKVFERVKMRRSTMDKLARFRLYAPVFGSVSKLSANTLK